MMWPVPNEVSQFEKAAPTLEPRARLGKLETDAERAIAGRSRGCPPIDGELPDERQRLGRRDSVQVGVQQERRA